MKKGRRPNILHLFVDQMRADAMSAAGNPYIKTPNLDRLASSGVRFSNAFSPSPVCVPARCSMIYGQYPTHTGCYENTPMPEDGRPSLMDLLSSVGYRTHGVGKCHFIPDANAMRGFQTRATQEEFRYSIEEDDYLAFLKERGYLEPGGVVDPHGVRGEMYYVPQVSQLPQEAHPTQWIGDQAIKFLESEGNSEEPWYLFTSFVHPHPPFSPPSPWHKIYRIGDVPMPQTPANPDALLTYVNRVQNRYKHRDQGFDMNLIRTMRAYYYACISFIDYQVGRVLDWLESSGQLRNTLIVFAGDHGEYLGDFGCFGKRGMHDVSAKIPLLAHYPGLFEGGRVETTPVSLVDLYPTFCDAAETVPKKHELDGLPLQEIVTGRTHRAAVYSQLTYGPEVDIVRTAEGSGRTGVEDSKEHAASSTYMIVTSTHKYFYSAPDDMEFLFDRVLDPDETMNRAYTPGYTADRDRLRETLIEFLSNAGETMGIQDGKWKRFGKKTVPPIPDLGLIQQDHPWASQYIAGYNEQKPGRVSVYGVAAK